jgi:hypothetical protein
MPQKGFWLKLGVLVAVERLLIMVIHLVEPVVIQKQKLTHQLLAVF